jgi:hypothetical protein
MTMDETVLRGMTDRLDEIGSVMERK